MTVFAKFECWCFAGKLVRKIATFAKPETVRRNAKYRQMKKINIKLGVFVLLTILGLNSFGQTTKKTQPKSQAKTTYLKQTDFYKSLQNLTTILKDNNYAYNEELRIEFKATLEKANRQFNLIENKIINTKQNERKSISELLDSFKNLTRDDLFDQNDPDKVARVSSQITMTQPMIEGLVAKLANVKVRQ
jgi:hypothetical protein